MAVCECGAANAARRKVSAGQAAGYQTGLKKHSISVGKAPTEANPPHPSLSAEKTAVDFFKFALSGITTRAGPS